jgi:hypothetical protein
VSSCPNCGHPGDDADAFCAGCGAARNAGPAPLVRRQLPQLTITGTEVGIAVRTGALVLAGYLAVCVVVAVLLLVFQDSSGNVWDWVRAGIAIATLGLHGSLFGTFDPVPDSTSDGGPFTLDGGLSVSYQVVPLVLLGLVLLLASRFAGRTEQAHPSPHAQQAAARGVVSAVAAVVGLAVLARIGRFGDGVPFGGDGSTPAVATGGAAIAPVLLWGIPLLALAFVAGHLEALRRRTGQPTLRQALAARSFGVAPWVATAALHAAVSAVILTAAGTIYLLATSTDEISQALSGFTSSDVSQILLVLLMLPNLALSATGFFMGFSVNAGGVSTVGLLNGDPPALTYLWCLAPLAAAALVGVRRALQTPAGAGVLSGWWQAGLGSLVVWVPLSLFLSVGVGGAAFFGDLTVGFTSGSVLLLGFAWGVLVLVLGRVLARPFASTFPGVAARLGGDRTHHSWRVLIAPLLGLPVPEPPVGSDPPSDPPSSSPTVPPRPATPVRRRTLALIAAVAVALVAAGVSYVVLDRQRYGPSATVESYLSALADGNVSEALRHVDTRAVQDRTLLTDAALPVGRRITDPKVTKAVRRGTNAVVTVTYTLGDRQETDVLTVRQHGSRDVLFHGWQITRGLGRVGFGSSAGSPGEPTTVLVNGVSVGTGRASGDLSTLPALPGLYEITSAPDPLRQAVPQTIRVTLDGGSVSIFLRFEVRPAAVAQAKAAVLAYLRSCLARATTLTTTCGFSSYAYADRFENLRWTLVGEPTFEVGYDESTGKLRVSTSSSIVEARVTGVAIQNDVFGGPPTRTPLNETATAFVQGTVTISGGKATYAPGF